MNRILIILGITFCAMWYLPDKVHANSAWAVIDADTGRLLMGENEHAQLPIASLTKIWTAFTVLESGMPLKQTTISKQAAMSEGSSIYLPQGTKVEVNSLLYGLMLRSGNDAAYALAEYVGGSVEGFTLLMNERAMYYGLNRTHFTNPSGLHDENHLSTAYETALMMYYAMQNHQFKKIASTEQYTLKLAKQTYHWQNKHRLLRSNDQAIAGKTGFTKAAGRTLVTYFEKDERKVIVVTLNDGNDWQTHQHLAEKAFSEYIVETVAQKGTYHLTTSSIGTLNEPIQLLLHETERHQLKHVAKMSRNGQKGHWVVYVNNEPILFRPLVMTE